MVDLALFSDWQYCSACELPAGMAPGDGVPGRACRKLMACADCR